MKFRTKSLGKRIYLSGSRRLVVYSTFSSFPSVSNPQCCSSPTPPVARVRPWQIRRSARLTNAIHTVRVHRVRRDFPLVIDAQIIVSVCVAFTYSTVRVQPAFTRSSLRIVCWSIRYAISIFFFLFCFHVWVDKLFVDTILSTLVVVVVLRKKKMCRLTGIANYK